MPFVALVTGAVAAFTAPNWWYVVAVTVAVVPAFVIAGLLVMVPYRKMPATVVDVLSVAVVTALSWWISQGLAVPVVAGGLLYVWLMRESRKVLGIQQ